MFIVGFTGLAGTGKDTAGKALVKELGFKRFAFADPLKNALNAMLDLKPGKWENREWKESVIEQLGYSPRHLAQTLGTEWGREVLDPRFWVKVARFRADNSGARRVVFTDVRFDNEAEWIQQRGGLVVEITRPGIEPVRAHVSEQGIHPRLIDFTIPNDDKESDFRRIVVSEISNKILVMNSI